MLKAVKRRPTPGVDFGGEADVQDASNYKMHVSTTMVIHVRWLLANPSVSLVLSADADHSFVLHIVNY